MNNATLIGRLTKDLELRFTQSGKAVASGTMAVNRIKKDDPADFIPIVIWGTQAENAAKYLAKGSKLAVAGRIQTRNYEANDGHKVYVTEVVASDVEYLDNKGQAKASAPVDHTDDFQPMTEDDDDLPF